MSPSLSTDVDPTAGPFYSELRHDKWWCELTDHPRVGTRFAVSTYFRTERILRSSVPWPHLSHTSPWLPTVPIFSVDRSLMIHLSDDSSSSLVNFPNSRRQSLIRNTRPHEWVRRYPSYVTSLGTRRIDKKWRKRIKTKKKPRKVKRKNFTWSDLQFSKVSTWLYGWPPVYPFHSSRGILADLWGRHYLC